MMKTSFTKLFKERWRAILPFLFLSTMSLIGRAEFTNCGVLDSIAEITLTIDCDGALVVSAKDQSIYGYVFGMVGLGDFDQHFYQTSEPFKHFALNNVDSSLFYVKETCSDVKWYGLLPVWGNGEGAGTYHYTGYGKNPDEPGTPGMAVDVPPAVTPTVSYLITRPSCPGVDDGNIKLILNYSSNIHCETSIVYTGGGVTNGSFINNMATLTGLPQGAISIAFAINPSLGDGCYCGVNAPTTLNLTIPAASNNTTSMACIDRVNISSSVDPYDCSVTIEIDDIMLGAADPCMMAMADYINVRDKHTKQLIGTGLMGTPGSYMANGMTGSGTAVRIADASMFFGKEVIIEVWDEDSGNHCWGTALIEDKGKPILSCSDPSLSVIRCIDFEGDMAEALRGKVKDCSDVDVTIVRQKTIPECGGSVLKQVELIYFATDEWGNKSEQCMDTILITRIGMRDTSINAPTRKTLTFVDSVRLLIPQDKEEQWNRALACKDFIDLDDDGAPDPVAGAKGAGFPMIEVWRGGTDYDTLPLPALNYMHYSDSLNRAKDKALTYCKIGANYSDILIGSYDCTTKYMRTWSVYEWSCEGELDTTWQQIIEIVDTLGPVFTKPAVSEYLLSVNSYSCSKLEAMLMPSVTDNCTPVSEIEMQAVAFDSDWKVIGPDITGVLPGGKFEFEFPIGLNRVVFTAFDACHNYTKDTVTVRVIDQSPPVTVCKEFLVVGISTDGTVRVPATSFDNGSYDDCYLHKKCAARMDDLNTFDIADTDENGWVLSSAISVFACDRSFDQYAIDTTFGGISGKYLHRDFLCQNDVRFCCSDDIANDVMVVFKTFDASGNSNECMVFVDIQDKSKPSLTCLPDLNITCDVVIPILPSVDSGIFINITDQTSKNYFGPYFGNIVEQLNQKPIGVAPSLSDAIYTDNCDPLSVWMKITQNRNSCGLGKITREYYVEDNSGNRSPICTQVITISSDGGSQPAFIEMPKAEFTIDSCSSLDAITSQASLAVFGSPKASAGSCMLLGVNYEDKVYYLNIDPSSATSSEEACFKLIRTWSIIDWCTTTNYLQPVTFEQIIKVIDNEAPIFMCTDTITQIGGQVDVSGSCSANVTGISVTVMDQECTPGTELVWSARLYQINPNGSKSLLDNNATIDIAVDGMSASYSGVHTTGDYIVEYAVSDRCGNTSVCNRFFKVTCSAGGNVVNVFIRGSIRTESKAQVSDTEVGLLGGNQGASALNATKTDKNGSYTFPAMPMGGQYVIEPVSASDYLNGVSTIDLVVIQRYILGLENLDSPYKIIAADVNNDKKVSAIDLVELRGVILGLRDKFNNNNSWRFVDANYGFVDRNNPLVEAFTEKYSISRLDQDMKVDFIGIKVGDINNSVDAAGTLAQSRSKFNLSADDQSFRAGDIIEVPLKASKAIDLIGFQFTGKFNTEKLQFVGVSQGGVKVSSENLGTAQLKNGLLTTSWNDVNAAQFKSDDPIIIMNFKAIASGQLSESFTINSEMTHAEIYNATMETMSLGIAFNKIDRVINAGFELGYNTPNPFADKTSISFTLPAAAKATFTVYDVTGKVLKVNNGTFNKGINTIEVSKDELASTGVLYYTLETDGFTDTKRMVVIK